MENKKGFIFNILWSLSGQFIFMFVLFITNILFAKVLSPMQFGQIGIVMFFVNLFNVLIESGLGGALVRKEETKKIDYDTVFVFNLIISLFLYILLFISAPFIADFYNDGSLTNLLQITSLILLINAFQITQNTKLIKELKFKKLTLYRTISVVTSSVVGLLLVYNTKLGIWAVVAMQVLNVFINTILLNYSVGGLNKIRFSKTSFRSLYKFGLNTTLASILNTVFDNIYNLVLGKYFSVANTGYYYQAKKMQDISVNVINTINHTVIYSTLSKSQSNPHEFYSLYKTIFNYLIFAIGFIALGMYLFSDNIILLILGNKWAASAMFMRYLSIYSFFFILEQYNRVIFKVFDKTHKILQLEVIKKSIQAASIVFGVYMQSLEILMLGLVITSVVSYLINYYILNREFKFVTNFEPIQLMKMLLLGLVFIISFKYFVFILPIKILIFLLLYVFLGIVLKFININELKKLKL